MSIKFDSIIKEVKEKYTQLVLSKKFKYSDLPKRLPSAGIYFFSEDGIPLYVGRTNNLKKRLQYHTRNNHNQATFAFLLARHETGNIKASYTKKGSRSDLLKDNVFREAFDRARERICHMDIQFVEESDPINQTILEVYAAFESGAKYNNFDNH
ncbi:MAG: GIY-YIG nuclease family protein [Gammaproteobacteria bacterium]|nr:GIY-YIG nuclease family protein [Gammaproteobacteria bacterium]